MTTLRGLRGLGISIPRNFGAGQEVSAGVGFDLVFYPPQLIVSVFPVQPYKSIDVAGDAGVGTVFWTRYVCENKFFTYVPVPFVYVAPEKEERKKMYPCVSGAKTTPATPASPARSMDSAS